MTTNEVSESKKDLFALSNVVRDLICKREYQKCEFLIIDAMGKYPHAPEPHNLIGILLENRDGHLMAMKHFRAACALDPTYLPAMQNLDTYGTFFSTGRCAFNENDCPQEKHIEYITVYDKNGIGHIRRK